MNPDKLYFKNLDAIRFIAALMVFIGHGLTSALDHLPVHNETILNLLRTFSDGRTGVSVFFVLSGFLITYLLIAEQEQRSAISLKDFYIRRVLRIWPLYYLIVLVSFLLYPLLARVMPVSHPSGPDLFYNLAFLSNFEILHLKESCLSCEVPMPQSINWSVSIEEQFYLLWPLVFVLLPKRSWIFMITLIIACSLWFVMRNDDPFVLYFHTLPAFINLGVGGVFAYMLKASGRIRTFFESSSTITHLLLFIFSFCLVFWRTKLFAFAGGHAIGQLLIACSFALIISAQAMTQNDSMLNLKNLSFATRWGKYTYGIYLIHPVALSCLDALYYIMNMPRTGISLLILGLLGFLLTLLLSRLSYRYYESRFLKLKEKFERV